MKALAGHISMTIVASAAFVWGGSVAARTASSCAAGAGAYPTFCSIPKPPTDVRSPAAIHREVLTTRLAGRDLVRATEPSTFTLGDTAGFSGRATTEAAPPPPVTTPSKAETEAFAKAARDTASPPKHPR
jgi:hypothetical protein